MAPSIMKLYNTIISQLTLTSYEEAYLKRINQSPPLSHFCFSLYTATTTTNKGTDRWPEKKVRSRAESCLQALRPRAIHRGYVRALLAGRSASLECARKHRNALQEETAER